MGKEIEYVVINTCSLLLRDRTAGCAAVLPHNRLDRIRDFFSQPHWLNEKYLLMLVHN